MPRLTKIKGTTPDELLRSADAFLASMDRRITALEVILKGENIQGGYILRQRIEALEKTVEKLLAINGLKLKTEVSLVPVGDVIECRKIEYN